MSSSRVAVFVVFIAIAQASCGRAADAEPGGTKAKPASEKHIADLIKKLSSASYKIREQASRELKESDEAMPALRGALKDADVEARRRLDGVIAAIEARFVERDIAAALARVNEEGIDLFLDRMVFEKGFADKRRPAVLRLASALGKRVEGVGGAVPKWAAHNYLDFPVDTACGVNANIMSKRLLVHTQKSHIGALHQSLLIGSGSIESIITIDNSILFVNGDIGTLNSATNSIIFCNGTIKGFNSTRNCLIFCNGLIEKMNYTDSSTVLVRGELRSASFNKSNVIEATVFGPCGLSQGNTYLNRAALPPNGMGDRLAKADPSLLTLFRYFDPARQGLTISMLDGDARVDGVTDGSPYARAGLKKGDLLLAVDRDKFMSRDAFVSLLRKRIISGEVHLKVQRDDRILQIRVRLQS